MCRSKNSHQVVRDDAESYARSVDMTQEADAPFQSSLKQPDPTVLEYVAESS